MATETSALGLDLPAANDFYDVEKFNSNFRKLDANVLLALAAAAPYSETQTYALGAYCTRDAKLYRCTTAITTAGAWTAAHWTETSMGAELVAIYAALAAKASSTHASQHASKGSDPITPAAIGAAADGTATNIDTHNVNGIFQTKPDCEGTFPSDVTFYAGVLIHKTWDDNYKEQIFLSYQTHNMYRRTMNGASWKGWKTAYDTGNITSGTTDLTAGTSSLATGAGYWQYE